VCVCVYVCVLMYVDEMFFSGETLDKLCLIWKNGYKTALHHLGSGMFCSVGCSLGLAAHGAVWCGAAL